MRLFFSPKQFAHRPGQFLSTGRLVQHLEVPERCERLLTALRSASYVVEAPREEYDLEPITRVHAAGYLEFLRTAWERWSALENAGPEVLPDVYPYRAASEAPPLRSAPRTESPIAQAGHYLGDLACGIGPGTWESAVAAVQTALAAAEAVLAGDHCAYALCRPPGHHAATDRAAGFCY